ncbi:hypothetical protein ACIBF7_26290 [Nonomuraea sp. NPDC050478]|uniref:hypothetical protein n=1 Tax=Nonomuraea sp. NPDC050478 TaxID=3364365 RepID=UPI003787F060
MKRAISGSGRPSQAGGGGSFRPCSVTRPRPDLLEHRDARRAPDPRPVLAQGALSQQVEGAQAHRLGAAAVVS